MTPVRARGANHAGRPAGPRLFNRELSWLDFNERVLSLAEDRSIPLLERVKFAAIFAGNLDEFYQVRVATLQRQRIAAPEIQSADQRTANQQLGDIATRTAELASRHAQIFTRQLRPALAAARCGLVRWEQLDEVERAAQRSLFADQVFPILTPLAVDPGHPFPYISNLSLNMAVTLRQPGRRQVEFARVKVPALMPRFIALEGRGYLPLEELIAANLDMLFPGMEILSQHPFRVTRASDIELDEDAAEDLLRALEAELARRRFTPTVRLEVDRRMPMRVVQLLTRELRLDERDIHRLPGPLGLTDLWALAGVERPDLKDPPFRPVTPPAVVRSSNGAVDIFATLDRGDLLVHHPYDSFGETVQAFIEQAADDPDVLAIKLTLYRTSGQSPIVDALIEAAAAGKQVVVLVEIKARFDEQANIAWARMLERAGCHVVYGLVGLKTHCKLALVVRRVGTSVRRYVHIGTGNYHPTTATLYEDVGLLTVNPDLAGDVGHLFNLLTGYSLRTTYHSLIVAPLDMRPRIIELITEQATRAASGLPAAVTLKLNSLVDEDVIESLYRASAAGVQVDLIVRGICALRPGVPHLSENIHVRSILGRFLEHSRIYRFGAGENDEFWIGSADMMPRNLDRRVEVLVRVNEAAHRTRLRQLLQLAMADPGAWELTSDGGWQRSTGPRNGPGLQDSLMDAGRAPAAASA